MSRVERLSGLTLLHVYRDISIDTDKIVREFCARKHHSLVFEFCTQTFLWPYIFECHSTLSLHYSYWTEVGNATFKLTDRNLKVQLTYFTGCETRVVYRCNCSNILVVGLTLENAQECPWLVTVVIGVSLRGDESGLCEHASTSRDKKFAFQAAGSLESTTREQWALLIFSTCSNPYGNPFL